jgi:hypothetical protein
MGMVLETNDELLSLEDRRESFVILDLQRKYPSEHNGEYNREVLNVKSEHIFAAADGEIEISKEFLLKLVKFFDNSENRKRLES